MKKYIIILNILVSTLFCLEKIGFIANVDGYVEIISDKNSQVFEVQALEGRYLYEGDVLRSYDNSYCSIVFSDQSALFSIVGDSEISFGNTDKNIKKIKLNFGQIYVENKSKLEPVFIFTQSSQIRSLNSSLFLKSAIDGYDSIYSILNSVDIYNKKSKLSLTLSSSNKAISIKGGDIELQKKEQSFLPEIIALSIEENSEMLAIPIRELGRNKGDLVPDYLSDYEIDTYKTKKKKNIAIEMSSFLSYLNNNPYSKFIINTQYRNPQLYLDFELAHYVSFKDSPKIDMWDESIKILAKIRELNYSNRKGDISIKTGSLKNITIGHGLLVKNYTNSLNYPLGSSYGLDFEYSSRDFFNIKIFLSNLDGGFVGFHSSVFVSKYVPLKLGFGGALDFNQFSIIREPFNPSDRNIKSFEFDSTYDIYNNKGYDVDLVSEIAAIVFPETHYYKRYNSLDNLEGGLKKKNGTWGTAIGIQGSYLDFFKIKTLAHYNDPLFLPSFFNHTYDLERYRVLKQKETYSGNIAQIDEMFEGYELDDLTIVPKDLYFAYSDQEFAYSSLGFTVEGEYNYYDKVSAYAHYSNFFEVGNSLSANTKSSLTLKLEVLDRVLKNIDKIGFYYSQNLSDKILNISAINENTVLGISLRTKIKFNLLFDFNFERVNYDYDYDGETDNIDNLEFGITYRL